MPPTVKLQTIGLLSLGITFRATRIDTNNQAGGKKRNVILTKRKLRTKATRYCMLNTKSKTLSKLGLQCSSAHLGISASIQRNKDRRCVLLVDRWMWTKTNFHLRKLNLINMLGTTLRWGSKPLTEHLWVSTKMSPKKYIKQHHLELNYWRYLICRWLCYLLFAYIPSIHILCMRKIIFTKRENKIIYKLIFFFFPCSF